MILNRDQLRAARMLLRLRQDELAKLADVGVVTIRRFENGHSVGTPVLEALKESIERQGIVLIGGDDTVSYGLALRVSAALPRDTRERLADAAETREARVGAGPGRPRRVR